MFVICDKIKLQKFFVLGKLVVGAEADNEKLNYQALQLYPPHHPLPPLREDTKEDNDFLGPPCHSQFYVESHYGLIVLPIYVPPNRISSTLTDSSLEVRFKNVSIQSVSQWTFVQNKLIAFSSTLIFL